MSLLIEEEAPIEGKICQPMKHSSKETHGIKKKINFTELPGATNSLVKSFIPSEIGCANPANLILSGPNRTPKELRHFRSIKVK